MKMIKTNEEEKIEVARDMAHPSGNEWLGDPEFTFSSHIFFDGEDAVAFFIILFVIIVISLK